MRCRGLGVALLGVTLLASSGASADSKEEKAEQAARAFDEATQLFAGGDYRKAAGAFERAYRLIPHGDAAYNAALSWERAGERGRAAEAFVEALGRDLRSDARADAEERFGKLKRGLALVSVVGPEGTTARLGGVRRETPAEFFIEPGLHQVFLEGGPRPRSRAVEARAGAEHVVEFAEKDRTSAPAADEDARPSRRRAAAAAGDGGSAWPVVGWTAVTAGAVLVGVAAVVGLQSQDARDTFNASDRTDAEKRDRALRLQTWTRVAYGAAIAVGGAGVVILLTADGSSTASDSAALAPRAPLPTGMALRGSF